MVINEITTLQRSDPMDNENKVEEEQILDDAALEEGKAEKPYDGDAAAAETAAAIKKSEPPQAKAPTTKTGMINAMVGAMKKMKKSDLSAGYGKIMSSMKAEGFDIDELEDAITEEETTSFREIKQISSADLNVEEDVKAIFGSEELTEEFKEKATTVFEAAVVSKVNEILETVTVDLEAELEVEKDEIHENLASRLDDYLEYVAEEWMKENELAVEQGIRAEIAENFMTGLRDLFAENYVDIPEEKVDLVDELAAKVEEQEASMNEEIDRNIELRKELAEVKSASIFKEMAEGLTETQSEKFKALVEGVDFEGDVEYAEKLSTIKESYFKAEEETLTEEFAMDDEPLELDEEVNTSYDPSMSAYMNAISRTIKK
jgi:hypothetical protein